MTTEEKNDADILARRLFERVYGPLLHPAHACMLWADVMAYVLMTRYFLQCRRVAGRAAWMSEGGLILEFPFHRMEAFFDMVRGVMPSVHAWVEVAREEGGIDIVDVTGDFLNSQFMTAGLGRVLPRLIWMGTEEVAASPYVYEYDRAASLMMLGYVAQFKKLNKIKAYSDYGVC